MYEHVTFITKREDYNIGFCVAGVQMERAVEEDGTHCCLVAIGRLQVTSTPNTSDLSGANSNNGES